MKTWKKAISALVVSMLAVSMFGGAIAAASPDQFEEESTYSDIAVLIGDYSGIDSVYKESAATGEKGILANQTYSAPNGKYTVTFYVDWTRTGTVINEPINIYAIQFGQWSFDGDVQPNGLRGWHGYYKDSTYKQANIVAYTGVRGGLFNAEHQMPYVGWNLNASTGLTTKFFASLTHWVDNNWSSGWTTLKANAARVSGSPQYWT